MLRCVCSVVVVGMYVGRGVSVFCVYVVYTSRVMYAIECLLSCIFGGMGVWEGMFIF